MDAGDAANAPLNGTEPAVYGDRTPQEVRGLLDTWAQARLASPIVRVVFRAGRIDAVWGVELADGRAVVIKAHRPPVDVAAVRVTREVQRLLVTAGFPSAEPLAGPEEVEGHVLTAETLISGESSRARDRPGDRRLLADGLARHIAILREHPELTSRVGAGPSWCRYQHGPWPVPHDTLVDFSTTPPGYAWVDDFGRRCADQILEHRDADDVVIAHADWYAGNVAVADGVIVGTYDWELVADTEAVLAGFGAASYASSASGAGGLSTPAEELAFLQEYEDVRAAPFSAAEQQTAVGAAAWIIAFNARWHVALIEHGICDEATVALARDLGEDYLSLRW